jgi:glucose-6-phosphate dehydrogenase assembly protein OpcA
MIIELPDTNTTEVNRQLIDLREKHGAIALGRVLTLIVVTDDRHSEAAISSAIYASYEHPCRVIAVVTSRGRGDSRLDAQIRVGGDAGASDVVLLHTYGDLNAHPASVIMPLLLPDAPTVVWWPAQAPEVPAHDAVGGLAGRRITDSGAVRDPLEALDQRRTGYRPGDTDLSWSRLTLWRAVLAAALDQEVDKTVRSASVVGADDSPSTELMAAWLADRLQCPVSRTSRPDSEGLESVKLEMPHGTIELDRSPDEDIALLETPGRASQLIALQHRLDRECLSEELRRLDPDEVYGDVLTRGLVQLRETAKAKRRPAAKKAAKATDKKADTRTAKKTTAKASKKTTAKQSSKASGS